MTDISFIYNSIKDGDNDEVLNTIIEQFLADQGSTYTVDLWRDLNSDTLRGWAYPPVNNYEKAVANLYSGNTTLEALAQNQLQSYSETRFAVEARFSTGAYYLVDGDYVARPEITATPNKLTITANGSDQFILTGLPEPCTVKVESATFTVTDGEFGFTTILAGEYTVTAEQFPYITKTWEVTAE